MVIMAPTTSLVHAEENQQSSDTSTGSNSTETNVGTNSTVSDNAGQIDAKLAEKEAKMKTIPPVTPSENQ